MSETETAASGPADPARAELYHQWLGVRYSHPSYYGLLGLAELETDEEAIQQAGRKAKRTLRAYQIGTYRAEALNLLTEVGQAVSVLTNVEKKREYDRDLRARWKAAVDELYKAHCEGAARDAAVLEVWLKTCAGRGVPVARLLPVMVRGLGPRLAEWPPHGGHGLALPVNLWLYRDALILGQGLTGASLAHRAGVVKHVQKVTDLPEGLARLVAEEVTRDQAVFARTRLLLEARRDPMAILVRLGARVRRYGGTLGRSGKVVVAVAALMGIRKRDMTGAVERLTRTRHQQAAAAAEKAPGHEMPEPPRRKVGAKVRQASYRVRDLVADRPQGLVIGLAVLIGVAAVAVIVAVAADLWSPWQKPQPAPIVTGSAGSGAEAPRPLSPDVLDAEAFKEFIKKYPSYRPELPEPQLPVDVSATPSDDSGDRPATTFFSVPAKKAPPKPLPKKKPAATKT